MKSRREDQPDAHLREPIAVAQIMNRVDDVERIDARGVDVARHSRRGRRVLWVGKHQARRRLVRHVGLRALERDRIISAVGTSESAIASADK